MISTRKFWMVLIGGLVAASLLAFSSRELSAQGATGTIKIKVALQGTPPTMTKLQTASDPFCAGKTVMDESVISGGGALKNAVAYLDGVAGTFTAPATSVVIDQNGCHYSPHVALMQVGQTLEIKNSDQTLHNVHCYKGQETVFNRAMFQGMANIQHKVEQNGNVLKLKCDVHPWMTGYIFVTKNPFAAVSGDDGVATIANVPAGAHTLKIWHEKLGEQTQAVTVTAGGTAEVTVTYQPGA